MIIGIDVGGTFTDVFALDESSGEVSVGKVTSTRTNESEGFLHGVRSVTGERPLGDVNAIIHGTTVGTNALLERKGARTAVLTTAGFADVLEMRRRDRPRTWGLWGDFRPVVERDMRAEVAERTLADGAVIEPIDADDVRRVARHLLDRGAQSIAICFLHSYADSTNEDVAARIVRELWPNAHVSVSSEILPEIREFERTSTTTLNAYLQPVVGDYLEQLEKGLAENGFAGRFLVVQSNGGVMTVERARAVPVRTALSGPAAGVIAASRIAVAAGHPNLLTGDMGGTSFDVAVVVDGRSVQAAQTTIDFGLVVRTPMIEMSTIGAGGGSIAWVDRGGLLQIGPESAGGVPGPVCYAMGNDRPTVTDANVVLGRINAERPIGGRAALDVAAARRAIDEHVGRPLGLSTEDAAEAIVTVAETRMSGALRIVSIERGHDPSKFRMVPFGGAGALHTCAFVRDLGLAGALVPRLPGVISALGCVLADMRYDSVRTWQSPLASLDIESVRESMKSSIDESRRAIESSGVVFDGIDVEMALDMSYVGQTHAVAVPLPVDDPNRLDSSVIATAFEGAYRAQFGRLLNGVAVRVLGVRTSVIGRRPEFDLGRLVSGTTTLDGARLGRRPVYVGGRWHDADVWSRLQLPIGATVVGPCVLEQPDATTLIEPGFRATVDVLGNLDVVRET